MAVLVREAKKEDLPQILSLLDALSKTKANEKKVLAIYKKLLASDYYFISVAQLEGQVVGTCSLLVIPSLQHGRPWGLLEGLVVAENFRKQGIGRQLIGEMMRLAREKKCYKVILTSRFSKPDVHEFWEKRGFEKHGFSFRQDML